MFRLRDAAEYIRTRSAPHGFIAFIRRWRRIISFKDERENRPPRFLQVVAAYRAGRPIEDICLDFGCSKSTVMAYRKMAGLPPRGRGYGEEKEKAVLAMYELKKPIAEISAALGVSEAYVSTLANRHGLGRHPIRKRGKNAADVR